MEHPDKECPAPAGRVYNGKIIQYLLKAIPELIFCDIFFNVLFIFIKKEPVYPFFV